MNAIHALTSQPWVIRLGWALLHFLWQGTAIAIVYAAIRFLFARSLSAGTRYTLACAALIAMAASPLLTFITITNGTSAQTISWSPSISEWKWLPPVAVVFWVSGVFWYTLRLFGAVQFTRRLRKSAHPVPEEWQQNLQQIAARLGLAAHQVRLMSSSLVNSPAVIGYLRPMVLVPVAFLTGLPAEQIIPILTHEMAHIRRKDYLACILQSIIEVALFYHPAVWWISSQVRSERELSCDDLVIATGADRLTYARALTELESVRPRRLTPQLAANGGSLMNRIRRVIEPSYVGSHELPGVGSAWAMLLLLFAGAGVIPLHSEPKVAVVPTPAREASPQRPATFDSAIDSAQKSLLFDPVFSAQLAEPRPMPDLPPAPRAAAPTGLIVESVTAKTGNDLALDGLRAEDFTVTENDIPQQISVFEYENVDRNANRRMALYFDMTSMPMADQLRSLDAAQKFISTQMGPTDNISIIRHSTAGVEVLQDFTGNRGKLFSVIASMSAAATDSPATTPSEKLAALQTALKKLGGQGEKKSLVYFSNGLNLSDMDNHAVLRVTLNDAVRAGFSIWPTVSDDALNSLAADTGAKPAANSADLAASIVAAEKSIASYYLIGYVPANHAQDGKYRSIKIAVNDTPDAKLDYRQGYFALTAKATDTDKEHQLEDALLAGEPVTNLPVAAEVNYFRQNNAESYVPLTVKIPGSAPTSATEYDFLAEIKDERGTTIQRFRDHMEIKPSGAPITWNSGANLLPGNYSIKILARDNNTGRIGTFLGKFTIQNLDREPQLPISSVVLSSQLSEETSSLPGKIVPSVTREFNAKNDMFVYLQAWEKGAKTASPLTARVAFYKGSSKIFEAPPVTVSEGLDPKSGMLPIRMNVALNGLKPGEYDCQVSVLDPVTQKSALWQKPVTIY